MSNSRASSWIHVTPCCLLFLASIPNTLQDCIGPLGVMKWWHVIAVDGRHVLLASLGDCSGAAENGTAGISSMLLVVAECLIRSSPV